MRSAGAREVSLDRVEHSDRSYDVDFWQRAGVERRFESDRVAQSRRRADRTGLGEVISPRDLIRNKRAVGRPLDLADVEALTLAAKRRR